MRTEMTSFWEIEPIKDFQEEPGVLVMHKIKTFSS